MVPHDVLWHGCLSEVVAVGPRESDKDLAESGCYEQLTDGECEQPVAARGNVKREEEQLLSGKVQNDVYCSDRGTSSCRC